MNERERLINWAKQLADPNWCLSVPKEAKDVITQLVKELEPRTITTVEELDALQIGSVVIDAHGDCFQRVEDADGKGAVVWAGDFMYASSSYLALPATVLHESEASK